MSEGEVEDVSGFEVVSEGEVEDVSGFEVVVELELVDDELKFPRPPTSGIEVCWSVDAGVLGSEGT